MSNSSDFLRKLHDRFRLKWPLEAANERIAICENYRREIQSEGKYTAATINSIEDCTKINDFFAVASAMKKNYSQWLQVQRHGKHASWGSLDHVRERKNYEAICYTLWLGENMGILSLVPGTPLWSTGKAVPESARLKRGSRSDDDVVAIGRILHTRFTAEMSKQWAIWGSPKVPGVPPSKLESIQTVYTRHDGSGEATIEANIMVITDICVTSAAVLKGLLSQFGLPINISLSRGARLNRRIFENKILIASTLENSAVENSSLAFVDYLFDKSVVISVCARYVELLGRIGLEDSESAHTELRHNIEPHHLAIRYYKQLYTGKVSEVCMHTDGNVVCDDNSSKSASESVSDDDLSYQSPNIVSKSPSALGKRVRDAHAEVSTLKRTKGSETSGIRESLFGCGFLALVAYYFFFR